jgi:hypothetical protein
MPFGHPPATLAGMRCLIVDDNPTFALIGLGVGLTFFAISITAISEIAPEQAGVASGLVTTGHELGGVFGVSIVSVVALRSAASRVRERLRSGRPRGHSPRSSARFHGAGRCSEVSPGHGPSGGDALMPASRRKSDRWQSRARGGEQRDGEGERTLTGSCVSRV